MRTPTSKRFNLCCQKLAAVVQLLVLPLLLWLVADASAHQQLHELGRANGHVCGTHHDVSGNAEEGQEAGCLIDLFQHGGVENLPAGTVVSAARSVWGEIVLKRDFERLELQPGLFFPFSCGPPARGL